MSSDSDSEGTVLLYVVVLDMLDSGLPALTRSGDNVWSGPSAGILNALEDPVKFGIGSGGGCCVIVLRSSFLPPKSLNIE